MDKVSRDQAEAEINSWLDYKKVNVKKRELYKDQIDILSDAICDGFLILEDKTFNLIQTLKFPIESDESTKTFTYKPRINMNAVKLPMANAKNQDPMSMIFAYASALTGQPRALFSSIDSEDYSIASAIVIFFLG